MTKHKHTPAPWTGEKVVNICNCYQVGLSIGYLSTSSKERRDEGEANAKLIAAAPDLLTALEEVSASLAWVALGQCRAMEDPPIMPPEMAIELARAAIAKATA